ncbi:carbon-nitrogen hydrolase family protein [bacterium]|nr:carbon-nitrogen hydrolase family protein [bacterium]
MRIAGVQMDITLADVPGNLAKIIERTTTAVRQGARLVIFPECALTGYGFESRDEAWPYSQTVPGPATEAIQSLCRELNCLVIFGLLEQDGSRLFNAAVMVGPSGVIDTYRKVHLPWLGVDRYVDYGDRPFAVETAGDVQVGLNICYDAGFPEASRCLALMGADLIALPTNWPPGAEGAAEYAINTRALENTIYYAAVNRVGTERGCSFIGQSRICDPLGRTLAQANHTREEILYAEIDPALARNKQLVRVAGANEVNRIADRRPEMYGKLIEPHKHVRRGRQ